MGLLRSGTQDALGLYIDGLLVQVAHLQRRKGKVFLVGLKSGRLASRLDLDHEEEPGSVDHSEDAGDILGLDVDGTAARSQSAGRGQVDEEEGAQETNSEVIYGLLGGFPVSKSTVAIALQEGRVFFSEFDDTSGLKGKQLKQRLLEEMRKERDLEGRIPLQERHVYFKTGHGKLLSIAHEDALEVLALLDELKPFIGRVQVGLVEPLEIALMNLVRLAYPAEDGVTAIVHLGQGFSRVLFMRQGEYLAFSQPIHQGGTSDQILNTVCSRILFEQDVADIPEISRVLLSGDSKTLEALPFFDAQFPESQVDYLELAGLDLSLAQREAQEAVSEFSVPIGLAWKVLQPGEAACYPVNFLPRARKRQQNPLELAWHSLALLTLLMMSFPLFGVKVEQQNRTIQELQRSELLAQQRLDELTPYVKIVDELHGQIREYERTLALRDTLAVYQTDWSTRLYYWTAAFESTGQVWLERFSTSRGDVDIRGNWANMDLSAPSEVIMYGKALQTTRAAQLASRLAKGQLLSLTRAPIRTRTTFHFDLTVPVSIDNTDLMEP